MSSTPSTQIESSNNNIIPTDSESSFPFPSNETKVSPNPADIVATSVVIFIIVATAALAFFAIRYRRRRRCLVQEEQTKDRETRENARHFSVLGLPLGNTDIERGPRGFEQSSGPAGKDNERTVDAQGPQAVDVEKNVFQGSLSSTAPTRNTTSPQLKASWVADPLAVTDTSSLSLPMNDTMNASVLPLYSEIVQPQPPLHSHQSTAGAGRPPSYEGFGDGKRRDA